MNATAIIAEAQFQRAIALIRDVHRNAPGLGLAAGFALGRRFNAVNQGVANELVDDGIERFAQRPRQLIQLHALIAKFDLLAMSVGDLPGKSMPQAHQCLLRHFFIARRARRFDADNAANLADPTNYVLNRGNFAVELLDAHRHRQQIFALALALPTQALQQRFQRMQGLSDGF